MAKVRTAIVGAGGFGSCRRASMRESGLFELIGCFDINPKAMAAAHREDGAAPCESYEAMLALPGLEAVAISTGAKFHTEQALEAMRRGLHVFVEKPLCCTPGETEALYRTRKEHGVVVGVGHNDHRHDPMCELIKQYLAEDKIGRVAAVECNTSHGGGFVGSPESWRFDPEKNPGGMLFQCGVHALHELMYLFGPVKEVAAFMRYDVHETRTADTAQTLLRFEDGLTASLNCYHVTAYAHRLRIFGTRGNLYVDTHERRAWYQERKRGEVESGEEVAFPASDPAAYRCGQVISFARAVRGEIDKPWPGLEEGARSVSVVFACEEASRTGQTVAVKLPA